MIEIREGRKVLAKGENFAEAVMRLRIETEDTALLYPAADQRSVHMRRKDENGEYPEVVVLSVKEAD